MSSSTVSRYRESSALTSPSKTYDQNDSSFAEDSALDAIAKEAELRLQYQREQTREARQIRHKELEKSARDENDDEDSPTIPIAKSNTNSLLLQKFLNGDVDLRSIEQRDLRRLLSELESKYKSLMITNSGLFNEKQALFYQIDTYKDILDEHYETFNQAKRQLKDKCRNFDLQKQDLIDLEHSNNRLKELLINCETIIEESEKQQTEEIFFAHESINEKLKRILNEKHQQSKEILKLKSDLEEEKNRSKTLKEQIPPDSIDLHNEIYDFEQQKQLMRELNELTNRLQRIEADNVSLQQENKRYEAQLTRYKQQLDDAERVEDELKQERRRLQRELRTVRDEYENERTRSDVLQRENARLRSIRKKNLLNTPDDELIILTNHLNDLPIDDSN